MRTAGFQLPSPYPESTHFDLTISNRSSSNTCVIIEALLMELVTSGRQTESVG